MYWRKEKLEPLFFTEDPSTAGCGKISTRGVTWRAPRLLSSESKGALVSEGWRFVSGLQMRSASGRRIATQFCSIWQIGLSSPARRVTKPSFATKTMAHVSEGRMPSSSPGSPSMQSLMGAPSPSRLSMISKRTKREETRWPTQWLIISQSQKSKYGDLQETSMHQLQPRISLKNQIVAKYSE
jgi:hypothetical protein